ncbi:hypothetical protein QYE76_069358 [Lolium multiflorum]|uniref:Uncharacterized protein n=1 Tax=Lolium multiflorum TaxID=4521 RepID=A0AAD8SHU7_LOLMU|nr:hypothetical protein QYE76_069358 [Lolium multiflorum]
MSNNVANSILSGVLKVSGFVANTLINSKPTRKFFKLCLVKVFLLHSDGYGDQAGEITQDYLHATGNALGVAWAVFKIRKAFDPKGQLKKSSLASSAHAVAKQSISRQRRSKQSRLSCGRWLHRRCVY